MRPWRIAIWFVVLLFFIPLFFSSLPSHQHILNTQSSSSVITYGDLNVSESGLPTDSMWGILLQSEQYANVNYEETPTNFTEYMNLFNIPTGNYFVYSMYTVKQTSTNFKELIGDVYIDQTENRINIQFYRVHIETAGIPNNVSVIMLDQYQVAHPIGHNFTIYMPNGSFSSYVGSQDYYSPGGLSFNVEGRNVNSTVYFTKCYNITLNFKVENPKYMSLLKPYPFDYILSYVGIVHSYHGVYQNNTTLSLFIPNGTYNVTLNGNPGLYWTVQSGSSQYGLIFNLVSSNKVQINVTGASKNLTILFSEKVIPLNNMAYFYYYDGPVLIPLVVVLGIVSAFIYFKNRKK